MLEALISKFAQIEDPRCDWRVEHKLLDILVIAVCAVLGEAATAQETCTRSASSAGWSSRPLSANFFIRRSTAPHNPKLSAPGRIRTYAPGSGGRCSIP